MRKKHKKLILKILTLAIAIAGFLVLAFWQKIWPFQVKPADMSQNPTIASSKQTEALDEVSQSSEAKENSPSAPESSTTESPQKGDQVAEPQSGDFLVTSQGFDSDGNYELRTIFNKVVGEGASCELMLNDQLIQTVEVQNMSNSSTCKGFIIEKTKVKDGINNYLIKLKSAKFSIQTKGEFKK